jgi:hypothetical protein
VVVEDDLLAETIVPQAQHHVDHQLSQHVLPDDDGAGHPQVVVWMRAVHERRQDQAERCTPSGREATHSLADGADEQRVRGADGVLAVQFGAAHGDEDDVVLAPVFLHLVTHRGLDVGAWLGPLDGGGDVVLGQNGINLLVAGVPYLLLQAANGVVLEEEVGLVGREQSFGCVVCHCLTFPSVH